MQSKLAAAKETGQEALASAEEFARSAADSVKDTSGRKLSLLGILAIGLVAILVGRKLRRR